MTQRGNWPAPPARARSLCAMAMALVVLAGCGSPSTPTNPPTGSPAAQVTVSLGIYSGRPDPTWALSDAQSAVLIRLLDDLPGASGVPPEGGLGYHGFRLVVRTAGQADEHLVAYRGAVAEPGAGARSYRQDEARSIERYVLETGRSHLTPTEVAAVEADLGIP